MPPKKKQRTSGSNQKADQPTSMDHVPPVLQKLKDWLGKAYELRHGSDLEHPYPLDKGGSLLQICQRCWDNQKDFTNVSFDFMKKIGLMPSEGTTPGDFLEKYANLPVSWLSYYILSRCVHNLVERIG